MKLIILLLLTVVVSASFGSISRCVADPSPVSTNPIPTEKAVAVTGTAIDNTGRPVPNLQLSVQGPNEGAWINIPAVTTAADGSFTIGQLVPGTYYIDPGTQWTVSSPISFVVPSGEPIRLSLKKSVTATVQGTVVDASGAPLPGVAVVFEANHAISNGSLTGAYVTATTDQTGYFSISNLPLDYGIQSQSFTKAGYVYQSGGVTSSQGDKLTISLIVMTKLGGTVSGIVRNGLNAPVANAWISCPNGAAEIRPIQTDSSGHFTLTSLPIGPADIYAAKGRYFGHLSVQISDKSMADPVTIVLSPMPLLPSPSDLVTGTQMVTSLLDNTLSSPNGGNVDFYRDTAAEQLETVSPTAGLNFLASRTKANSYDLQIVLPVQSKQDPTETAQWVVPVIENAADNGHSGHLAAVIGLDLAPYDINAATTLYNFAASKISLDKLNDDNIINAMRLVSLAYAIHRSDAAVSFIQVMAELNRQIAAAKANPTIYNDTDVMKLIFAKSLARGNLSLALTLVKSLPLFDRQFELSEIVDELVWLDPDGALTTFHAIDKDDPNTTWVYDDSLAHVLPIIFKKDPLGAVSLARSIFDPADRSRALAIVADLMPLTLAEPLYNEAESCSEDRQSTQSATPDSIAAHAYLRDHQLGTTLFQQAYDKVMLTAPPDQPSSGPSYAEFAFYYSRFDPGYSRLLVEDLFRRDSTRPNANDKSGDSLLMDVSAMAAIDTTRANELANSIADPETRFFAGLAVVQYVLMSQHSRDTLSFTDWTNMGDSWTPVSSNVW